MGLSMDLLSVLRVLAWKRDGNLNPNVEGGQWPAQWWKLVVKRTSFVLRPRVSRHISKVPTLERGTLGSGPSTVDASWKKRF